MWFRALTLHALIVHQDKRLAKLLNYSKSITEIAPEASLYIPMTIPSNFSNNVQLNPKSTWHVTALLATAFESALLPSRLVFSDVRNRTLDHVAALLNVNGHQKITRLQLEPSKSLPSVTSDLENGHTDLAQTETESTQKHGEDHLSPKNDGDRELMDLLPKVTNPSTLKGRKSRHTFGSLHLCRGLNARIVLQDLREHAHRRQLGQPISDK